MFWMPLPPLHDFYGQAGLRGRNHPRYFIYIYYYCCLYLVLYLLYYHIYSNYSIYSHLSVFYLFYCFIWWRQAERARIQWQWSWELRELRFHAAVLEQPILPGGFAACAILWELWGWLQPVPVPEQTYHVLQRLHSREEWSCGARETSYTSSHPGWLYWWVERQNGHSYFLCNISVPYKCVPWG